MPLPPTNHEYADAAMLPAPDAPALSGGDLLLWSALPDLSLNIAQTAALCGVSVRQIGYWTKQGYVTAAGRGARRLYGPESLRRILGIHRAMQNGLSLRQALRALDQSSPNAFALTPGAGAAAPDASALSEGDADALAVSLLALLDGNPRTRDSAAGLGIKLGRTAGDVGRAAERLAGQGALTRTPVGGETVYARPEGAPR